MRSSKNFTEGKILMPLVAFMLPVLFALFLQSMYGAVDLLIVGRFSGPAEVSAVSTGSQIMMVLTTTINGFAMGTTVCLGQALGRGRSRRVHDIIGSCIALFTAVGLVLTPVIPLCAPELAGLMRAPAEAFDSTTGYIAICGLGSLPLLAYNLFGGVFRGLGDSVTPLVTVAVACFFNIVGDVFLVGELGLGAKGAAIATVAAQSISVGVALLLARKHETLRGFGRKNIRFAKAILQRVVSLGAPIALQDLLVGISFLFLLGIVNRLGLVASAGGGVGEKISFFILLVPIAFMDAMSAFTAQNFGAGKMERAEKALRYGIGTSLLFGTVTFWLSFFHGDLVSALFTGDGPVIEASFDYLRGNAPDCILTCFMFCFIGYFNGMGLTRFVMLQGIVGAFLVRIPVAYFASGLDGATLFHIGLATPVSTLVQILLCLVAYRVSRPRRRLIKT